MPYKCRTWRPCFGKRMKAEMQALYRAILHDLRYEGESERSICGNHYSFLFSDYGTEITCDGEFLCEISTIGSWKNYSWI